MILLNTALYEDKAIQCGSSQSTTVPDSANVGDCQVEITVPIRVECYILNEVIQSHILSIRTLETWNSLFTFRSKQWQNIFKDESMC
ncbi:hypothetical protein DPMN_185356 [Dreissena polymorpha]|uniref:Uncharacterized protein n=1 Tax=Dreissena polymorpha TaxID=45954 RepID=A0A9D4I5H1_DREPO|nr:hypothetical protein DPMN_185356 [Dreissena polymorpha]